MADTETPAAESSPAATANPGATAGAAGIGPNRSRTYAEWRQTGKLPEKDGKPSKGEDSGPSKNKSVDDESEKGAPVSETGKKGRSILRSRIDQLVLGKGFVKGKA